MSLARSAYRVTLALVALVTVLSGGGWGVVPILLVVYLVTAPLIP